jgi:hypothetical protein
MAIQCSCDFDDGSWDFFDERTVKARKEHVCGECREKIQPGEEYSRATGKFDGVFETSKTCRHCKQIAKNFGCYTFGELFFDIRDWAEEGGLVDLPMELFDDLEPAGVAKLERFVLAQLEKEEVA